MSLKLTLLAFAIIITAGIFASVTSKAIAATYEEQAVSLINSERQKQGLSPFNTSDKLYQAALKHNNTMFMCSKQYGRTSCFTHQVTLFSEPTLMERIKSTGYNPRAVAENIAWGYTSPSSVVSGWMNSSGHRANILGNYKDIGCDFLDGLNGSYTGMYWTCNFGTSFSTTTTPSTPTPTPTKTYSTPSPTRTIAATPTPTQALIPTPTSIIPSPTAKPWWCMYVSSHYMCN